MKLLRLIRPALGTACGALSLVVAREPARPAWCMLSPTRCDNASSIVLDSGVDHRARCKHGGCTRCSFWNTAHGMVRKGRRALFPVDARLAWTNLFTYTNSDACKQTWLCERPPSFGGPWGYGCYVCNVAVPHINNMFAEVLMTRVKRSECVRHARSDTHALAVKQLRDSSEAVTQPETMGVHGIGTQIPRLDRWVQAASVVERSDSFADFKRSILTGEVGSQLPSGVSMNDTSRGLCKQLIVSLAEPLRWRDAEVLRNATVSSIGIDERDSVLLVYARTYCRKTNELYDCLLGLARGFGTEPSHCMAAIAHVVDKAFTFANGRAIHRTKLAGTLVVKGGETVEDTAGKKTFLDSVRSAVADGGPTEQRALYDCSTASVEPAYAANPYFKNLDDICRDRAHKWRTVQKGFWEGVGDDVKNFLTSLVTGEHSFARMVQTSLKYRLVWKRKQQERMLSDSAECFCKIVENLSHKEARFDSRSEPLFRFFSLIGVAIDTLVELAEEGNDKERQKCSRLLAKFGGPEGYDRLVSGKRLHDCDSKIYQPEPGVAN